MVFLAVQKTSYITIEGRQNSYIISVSEHSNSLVRISSDLLTRPSYDAGREALLLLDTIHAWAPAVLAKAHCVSIYFA